MRSVLIVCLAFTGILMVSCQKEVDFDNSAGGTGGSGGSGGSGGGTMGNTLVKTVAKNGSQTVTTVYTYNAAKKLINEKVTGTSQGINVGNEYRYYRNASNIITHYTQVNELLAQAGVDSVTTYVYYNATTSKYTHTISELSFAGISVIDSTVLVYNGAGKVIRSDVYQRSPLLGPTYDLREKTFYTYSANGNVTQQDMHSFDSGTDELLTTSKYTFDSKPAPLILDNEAFAIGRPDAVSVNNVTKVELLNFVNPASNQTVAITYTYNPNQFPGSGVSTRNPGNVVNNLTFFYQ